MAFLVLVGLSIGLMHDAIRGAIEVYNSRMIFCGITFHDYSKLTWNSIKLIVAVLSSPRYVRSMSNLRIGGDFSEAVL